MSEIMTAKDLCLWYGDNKALPIHEGVLLLMNKVPLPNRSYMRAAMW